MQTIHCYEHKGRENENEEDESANRHTISNQEDY